MRYTLLITLALVTCFLLTKIAFSVTYECTVAYIVDGDTFDCQLDSETQRIRLIGVDAPESRMNAKTRSDIKRTGMDYETIKKMGKASTEFLKTKLKIDDTVKLETDIQEYDSGKRLLAYVWLDRATMLNEVMVREGYAEISTHPPNVKYVELFKRAQEYARMNNLGLWQSSIKE